MPLSSWDEAQNDEADWWGDCVNTFQEESKQRDYATRMGLVEESVNGKWPVYRLGGANVLDMGGGPTSLLLKCIERGAQCSVVDPCPYPEWVARRYEGAGIRYYEALAEDFMFGPGTYTEVWIYNVLQHVEDPEAIIRNAWRFARTIRLFEWIGTKKDAMHLSAPTPQELSTWLHGGGTAEYMPAFHATAWYGVFER